MKCSVYKSNNESILKDLETLDGVFFFPLHDYEISKRNISTFSIESILISYDSNNDRPFQASFLKHLARLDEHTFYAIFETDELNKENNRISSSTYMINFIATLNHIPFFITDKKIIIVDPNGNSLVIG